MSINDWVNPNDPNAEIKMMKTGQTRLGYKVEQAVDLDTGAVVGVTAHGAATGDTSSINLTLPFVGEMVADEIATKTTDGKYEVNPGSIEAIVTDKGYFSGETLKNLSEMGVWTYTG